MNALHVIQAPSGRFVYAGTVPACLAFVQKHSNAPATEAQIEAAKHVGPGIAGVRERAFASREAAVWFAESFGFTVEK